MRSGSGLFYGALLPQRLGSGARHFILPAATVHALKQAKGAAPAASIFALMCSLLIAGNSSGSASEFGADRKYDAEYITRVKPENPDAVAPPSALRRSMSSRTGGTAMDGSESRGYIKRRVSWNANTVGLHPAPLPACGT